MNVSPNLPYSASADAVACPLGDGLAILSTATNRYYSLNAVGAFIWSALDGATTPEVIAERVADRYRIGMEIALPDVLALMADLASEGLVAEARHDVGTVAARA